ncbi:MAG: Glyoxylate/hydroxypyruvate reductase B [Paracidovorax wautersii]|uniref:Glyoxylate/hydroxypyruvate reductase B n=1 Tax=Paracidovorax wautersii TaxID=1177982 RepID=A0A7V8FLS7_9BURK|nr:MAG: Glyoxylate/hydroxypyruvate reductase B [Paracidovorax wautersii]
MTSPRRQVLVFRELPPEPLAQLQAAHDVTVANPRVPGQLAAFEAALPGADALVGSSYRITDALLDRAPRLKVISSISVGVDNYPVASLRRRGIVLCHTPGVLTETTADTLFALLMATSRRIPELAQWVREGRWTKNIGEDLFGWDVHGKTLGIVGMGRIGQALARRAALGFGMRVLYSNRRPVEPAQLGALQGHVDWVPRDDLLARADFVTLMLPLTDETRGLMDATAFARMKPGAIFINGSRGAIVDEAALLQALDHGTLRAAGLDVFATEPLPLASPLRTHARVVALPHIGSATHETRQAMAALAVTNVLAALAGQTPPAVYG